MCDNCEPKPAEKSNKIEDHFLNSRKVFLYAQIDTKSSHEVIQKLLYLDSLNHDDIVLYIQSPGGSIDAGFAIMDCMNQIESDVVTVVTGSAASMGALLQCCGAKGKRYAWPHSRIMIHQPLISGQYRDVATNLEAEADVIDKMKVEINHIIAEKTGQDVEKVAKDTDRDCWMSAEEALEYGMIDHVGTV